MCCCDGRRHAVCVLMADDDGWFNNKRIEMAIVLL
jgi:hypothetical protein